MRVLILCSLLMLLSVNSSFSQDNKSAKQEKKALKNQENQEKLEALYKIVESRKFIVEANSVSNNEGETFTVSPSINYFYVDSLNSTIQLSFEGLIGWNGIGGITADGSIDKYDLSPLKQGKPITLTGMIIGRAGGNTQFVMYVNSEGMATVSITGNWGNTINFQGRLLTLAESKVFKGIPLN